MELLLPALWMIMLQKLYDDVSAGNLWYYHQQPASVSEAKKFESTAGKPKAFNA